MILFGDKYNYAISIIFFGIEDIIFVHACTEEENYDDAKHDYDDNIDPVEPDRSTGI